MASSRDWKMLPRRPIAVLKAFPFTASLVAILIVVGLSTETMWDALSRRPLLQHVAYGLPALQHGRWWTPVTGSLFALNPGEYFAVIGVVVVLVGFAEWRLGSRWTALLTIGIQLGVVIATSGLVLLLRQTGWAWPVQLSHTLDVGFSAGAIGVGCAATASLRPPWRGRMRVVLVGYVCLLLLYEGTIWDLEHFLAAGVGLFVGPYCVGRTPSLRKPTLSRHEWRLAAFAIFVVTAAIRLIVLLTPSSSIAPLRPASTGGFAWTDFVVGVLLPLALAEGLRRGRKLAWRISIVITALGALVYVLAVVVLAALVLTESSRKGADFDSFAAAIADALPWVLQLLVLILGRRAFRATPWLDRRHAGGDAEQDRAHARELLHKIGGGSLSWMTTWNGNSWYFPEDDAGYATYQIHSGVAIGLCDPVGAGPDERADIADSFVDAMEARGAAPCFFSVTDELRLWAVDRGWQGVEVALEAVIELPKLEFKGKAFQDIRTALNRANKDGIRFELATLSEVPRGVLAQVRMISEQWVGDKGLPEMGFTLGGVPEALDPEVKVGLAIDAEGTVHGVTSWLPSYGPDGVVQGWTLDVMRRLPDGFRPVMEFLIASACIAFQAEGAQFVSLSGAPLAGDPAAGGDPTPVDLLLSWLGEQLEPVYGFKSLEKFKAKFYPRSEPLFLLYPDESALPRIGIALTRAYLPNVGVAELASAGLQMRHGASS